MLRTGRAPDTMKTNAVDGVLRVGLVATDPLRILGLQTIFQDGQSVEIVLLTLAGTLEEAGLSMVMIDSSCTEYLFELLATFRRTHRRLKVIVLGLETDHEYVQRVIAAGAKGYLAHGAKESEVRMAIEVVADGSLWAPRKVIARLLESTQDAAGPSGVVGTPHITEREGQVRLLLVAGRSNREIAVVLGVDPVAVKSHVWRLMRKVGVPNRIALTMEAVSLNLVPR